MPTRTLMPHSFPLLIHALADAHHRSCLLTMAQASDIPYTTLWRWERGMSRQYSMDVVQRLCEHYHLDERQTWDLIRNDRMRRSAGQRVQLPDLSFRKRGPIPASRLSRARRMVTAVALSLGAALAACPPAGAEVSSTPIHGVETTVGVPIIGTRPRRERRRPPQRRRQSDQVVYQRRHLHLATPA